MTNLEYIRTCSDDELVRVLCEMNQCSECIASDYCFTEHNGFIDWLKKERGSE